MDCEMVGVGPCGTRSILARVSLVSLLGGEPTHQAKSAMMMITRTCP
jgi:hypothetical protein